MDIDLDDARIRRDLDDVEAGIEWRRIAFHMHRDIELGRRRLDRSNELEVILKLLDRRHEDTNATFARLDRQGGAHRHGGGGCRTPIPRRGVGLIELTLARRRSASSRALS